MSRLQLALNVDDLEASVEFYAKLFDTPPAKVKPGYANFAVAEPPLKLVLIANPGQGGSVNHLGVEVADAGTVDAEQTRLAAVGLAAIEERDETCCYARQTKFWVEQTPNGEQWEIYTVLEDSDSFGGEPATAPADDAATHTGELPATGATCCGTAPDRAATAPALACC